MTAFDRQQIIEDAAKAEWAAVWPGIPYETSPGRDLHRMADVSDEWAALVPRWDLLVAAMEAEIPGVFDGPARGRAPVTCALIQHLTGRTNR